MVANERVQRGLFSLQHSSIEETEQKPRTRERSPMSSLVAVKQPYLAASRQPSAWSFSPVIACVELQVE